jgi:hypothetical protein
LQAFAPADPEISDDISLPLEVLVDFRGESRDFNRLVPQSDATFHYDKFNRLRLRNNVTSATTDASTVKDDHLKSQTVSLLYTPCVLVSNRMMCTQDLVQVCIPKFTLTANERQFSTVSSIVTKLLLFSDPARKIRTEKLEKLSYTYDFTDVTSAAEVVRDLQTHLRSAKDVEHMARQNLQITSEETQLELLKLKAHMLLLSDELNLIFDAIKTAQDRAADRNNRKSALQLHAFSNEISWRMLDENHELLAKMAVKSADYRWLSNQDSSTENILEIGDLQAFDGSPDAIWPEILSKNKDPSNHPLCKVWNNLTRGSLWIDAFYREAYSPSLTGECLRQLEELLFMKRSKSTSILSACSLMPKLA